MIEIAAVVFFLVVFLIAFVGFRLLKKTVKLAFRLMMLFVLLLAAVTGAALLLYMGGFFAGS